MYGIYSLNFNCFVKLFDITRSGVDPALQNCILAFCEKEGAEKAVDNTIRSLCPSIDPYEVRPLPCVKCDD